MLVIPVVLNVDRRNWDENRESVEVLRKKQWKTSWKG